MKPFLKFPVYRKFKEKIIQMCIFSILEPIMEALLRRIFSKKLSPFLGLSLRCVFCHISSYNFSLAYYYVEI